MHNNQKKVFIILQSLEAPSWKSNIIYNSKGSSATKNCVDFEKLKIKGPLF